MQKLLQKHILNYSTPILPCLLFSLYFFLFCTFSIGQDVPAITQDPVEEIMPLQVNPTLFNKSKKPVNFEKHSTNWIYYIDMLSLPFIDDFSTNRIKNFNLDTTNSNVVGITKVNFEVNGIYLDSVAIIYDTTWYYQYNSTTSLYDSFPNSPMVLTFFGNNNPDSSSFLTMPTDTDTVWSNITYRYNLSDTDTVFLSADTVLYNSRDSFFFVFDDPFYLWLDSNVYINNGFAINPPTIGVASFDGLNAKGEPYDFSAPLVQGEADNLTSKPIDLSSLPSDSSIILSFYYQPQGNGDFPDIEDSLVLEFYSPVDSLWHWVWSHTGINTAQSYSPTAFQFVKIPVTDTIFLKQGFAFRFRNYATLSGMLDIWNIDYVYLDKNRIYTDNSVYDLAFSGNGVSFLNNYTSMPMNAFKGNASQFMVQNFTVELANLNDTAISADSSRYFVNSENSSFTSVGIPVSFAPLSELSLNHSVYFAPNNFSFLPSDSPMTVFDISFVSGQTLQDINPYNDTVVIHQVFDSYYSYDDGSAEGIYALGNKPGVKLAYKFNTLVKDSLKGLFLYFPYMLNDVSPFIFEILVWDDNNGLPNNIVYQGGSSSADYSSAINDFVRYKIYPPVPLEGTFYVGWKQISGDKIYLGFDKNTDNQNKIFHTLAQDNSWANTSFTGSLMMRPDFGNEEIQQRTDSTAKRIASAHIYPNPAADFFYIGKLSPEFSNRSFEVIIYNTLGKEILRTKLAGMDSPVDISSIQTGIYFLQIEGSAMEKIIIAR